MIRFVLVLTVTLAALCIAAVTLARSPHSPTRKLLLFSIRFVFVASMLLAYFEPSLPFKSLTRNAPEVRVFIDASQSMNLFTPDSLIIPWLLRQSEHRTVRISLWSFGDSLRRLTSIRFTDRKSRIPSLKSRGFTMLGIVVIRSST